MGYALCLILKRVEFALGEIPSVPEKARPRKGLERWIPRPYILHPYPDVRFDATIRGKSRVR